MTVTPDDLTAETAAALLEEWQKRLRLSDWDIEVKVVRHHDIQEKSTGDCDCYPCKRIAIIRLLDGKDDRKEGWTPLYDPELTLVHELLHIYFWFSNPSDNDWTTPHGIAQEQAVHFLSQALVNLKRERAS